jgi:hypothetical protein
VVLAVLAYVQNHRIASLESKWALLLEETARLRTAFEERANLKELPPPEEQKSSAALFSAPKVLPAPTPGSVYRQPADQEPVEKAAFALVAVDENGNSVYKAMQVKWSLEESIVARSKRRKDKRDFPSIHRNEPELAIHHAKVQVGKRIEIDGL